VRKIGFTGSTAVGKLLMAGAAKSVKRMSLELGGNAPFIVFEDADLELAARGAVMSALRNAGQTCICANRVFVHEAVYDKFADLVLSLVLKLKVGEGLGEGATMGPLISQAGVDKVHAHVTDAVAKGAKILTGGKRPSLAAPHDAGMFYEPTVLSGATFDMRCFSEETFGPLLPLFKFSTDEEAIMMANKTEYGLAAYFYTRDLARAWRMAEDLEYGMVGLNEVAITSEVAPFGGVKQSGLGRESSKYGLAEFQDIKYVCMGLGADRR
jgi:acyl-CoA reductase-like NAD-dependent aldehyde dehydrogenase